MHFRLVARIFFSFVLWCFFHSASSLETNHRSKDICMSRDFGKICQNASRDTTYWIITDIYNFIVSWEFWGNNWKFLWNFKISFLLKQLYRKRASAKYFYNAKALFPNMNMCINSDYFRIESTNLLASSVNCLILVNSPVFTSSPFTIQLPPQQTILSQERYSPRFFAFIPPVGINLSPV